MSKKSHKSETDHLKELIMRSGFPLEIEMSSFLVEQRASWHSRGMIEDMDISTSPYFLDKDTGEGRELDIKVDIMLVPRKDKFGPPLFLTLLIACKNIPGNAWVFFRSPHRIHYSCKSTSILDGLGWVPRMHAEFTLNENLHFRRLPMVTAYDEYVLNKKKSNKRKDNLFEAIISLAKATSFEIETYVNYWKEMIESSPADARAEDYVIVYYPIVVFNGKMFLAQNVAKGSKMNLTQIDHVGLYLDYTSGSYEVKTGIEILHRKAFKRVFKAIERDLEIFRNELGIKGGSFTEYVTKALDSHLTEQRGPA